MLDFLKKPDFRKPKIHHDLFSAWHGQGKGGKKKSKKFFVILSFALILGLAGSFLYPFYRQKALVHADSLIKFDEGNGTSANDTNASVSAGTITNAVWKPEDLCKSGKCMFFDGTQDYVSFTDDADLDFAAADSFTISFWFRHAPKTSGTEVMVVKLEAVGTDGGYQIQMEADGDITCQIEDDDADTTIDDSISSTAATYDDNRWHYVSCVKSGTSSLTLYIDAVQITQDAALDASGTLANDDTFYIGIDGDGTSNDFTGFIDEVKVYRSARTASEVKADFAGTTTSRGSAASFGPDQSFLSNGLVGYWKMDETATPSVDSSGNGNSGTWNGNTAGTTGKYGNGTTYDGTGDNITVSGDSIRTTGNTTISLWVKSTSADTNRGLFYKDNGGGTGGWGMRVMYSNSYIYASAVYTAPSVDSLSTDAVVITSGQWNHVTAVWKDGQYIQLFINGVESSKVSTTGTTLRTSNQNHSIGGRLASEYFTGQLDDVRIYNRAFSPAEVSRLYNWGSGLLGWWKMDEGSADTCSGGVNDSCDSSGNGYDGAWNGHATSTNGRFGNGVTFDGTGDYVDAGDIGL